MSNLRPSGIPFVQELSWGTHVCVFYSTPQDLMNLLVRYFKTGLTHHEFCIWVTPNDLQVSDARDGMRKALGPADQIRLQTQMEIFSQSDWYQKHRRFDQSEIRKAWMKKITHALEQGYEGLRFCGEIPWLKGKHLKDFEKYEKEIDKIFARKRIVTLCAYSIREYKIDDLMRALGYHGFVLIQIQNSWHLIELSQRQTDVPASENYEMLTPRERQVMRLISEGLTNAEIASSLSISVRTVETHRAHLMSKLGLKNQVDLIRFVLTANMASLNRAKMG